MKNIFALTLIAVATIVMSTHSEAFQPPGGQRGQRGGFGGGERGGPGGGGGRGGPGGQRGGPGPMEIPIIKALDTDGDGNVSTAEMQNAATALATLDANGDGMLDHSEMMPQRGGRRGGGPGGPRGGGDPNDFVERVMGNDADGDGKISLAEAPQQMQDNFVRLDGDSDGFVTREELTEAAKRWNGGGGAGGRGRGQGQGQRPQRPGAE